MLKVEFMKTEFFSKPLQTRLDALVAKYETRRAPLLEVLRLVMEEKGHITLEDERSVAEYLGVPEISVREVMTFYTLYYTQPRAKTRFAFCRTLSCHLAGGTDLLKYLEDKLGIKAGETSKDGKWSIQTVECLGACEIAPMMQVNDREFVGPLTKEKIDEIIQKQPMGTDKTL